MIEGYRGRTPVELLNFFRAPGGHSLLIKGDAGTGKTTLALQLIEELSNEQPDYYLSTRVSDAALYRQFPWLEEKAKRHDILKAGKAFLSKTQAPSFRGMEEYKHDSTLKVAKDLLRVLGRSDNSSPMVVRSELMKLEGQIESGEGDESETVSGEMTDDGMVLDIGVMLPELELAYDMAEANLPNKTFIVLDSIDALSEHYGISPQKIMNTLQKDLVEHSGTNIAYVMETSEKNIYDYLGDGVVRLYNSQKDGRRVRELVLEKLRGQMVKQWKYHFTLVDGRLRVFETNWFNLPDEMEPHTPIKDPGNDMVSMGNENIDKELNGLRRGSLVLLEIGENVPQDIIRALEYTLIADFLCKRRGVFWFPLFAVNYEVLDRHMRQLTSREALSGCLRILDHEAPVDKKYDFVSVIEGADAAQDLKLNSLKFMLSRSANEPYLSILGFDSLEALYGVNVLPDIFVHMEAMKRAGNVVLAEATSSSASLKQLTHQARTHLKLESLAGTVMLCGQKPVSPYYFLDFESAKERIVPRLIPMV
ncbi:MAG: gas vesicle protein GvpD P-loop domain-containing protein [Methanomassiliicoccales archaeon]